MSTIIIGNNPFDPHDVTKYVADTGNLAEWAKNAPINKVHPHIGYLNGYEDDDICTMSEWADINLSENHTIVFIPQHLGNGGGGSNPLKVILALAVVVFAPQIAGFLGSMGAGAAVTSTMVARFGVATLLSAFVQPAPAEAISMDIKQASPTYSVSAQGNATSLGSALSKVYGNHIIYPSFIAAPWVMYANHEQVLTQIFHVGLGKYVCEEPKLEDTAISNFTKVDWAFIYYDEQGVASVIKSFNGIGWASWESAAAHRAVTSVEVAGQELLGTNEAGYGYIGGFIVNKSGTEINQVDVDVVFPRGLYYANNDGSFANKTVTWGFEARKVDNSGSPVGNWFPLSSNQTFTGSSSSSAVIPQPPEFTGDSEQALVTVVIDTGVAGISSSLRYSTAEYNSATLINYSVSNSGGFDKITATVRPNWNWVTAGEGTDVVWAGLVKFNYNYNYTTAVTTPSVTAATNEVLQYTYSYPTPPGRYEVRGRRTDAKDTDTRAGHEVRWAGLRGYLTKAPVYQNQTILFTRFIASDKLAQQASRKVNCVVTSILPTYNGSSWSEQPTRNPYWAMLDIMRSTYGGRISDSAIGIDEIKALAMKADQVGDTFDYVFDQRTTVWDALSLVGKSCKTAISRVHGVVYPIRDEPRVSPVMAISTNQIESGSFQIERIMPSGRASSWVEVEYFDRDTWSWAKVAGGVASNDPSATPLQVRCDGITTASKALEMAGYLSKVNTYRRQFVTFSTELDGFIPTYGDLIMVSHDLPSWGQSTYVVSVAGNAVTLANDVEWGVGSHTLAFRLADGKLSGAYSAAKGASDNIVVLSGGTFPLPAIRLYGEAAEPTTVLFGVGGEWAKQCLVLGCRPKGLDKATINAVVDDVRVYTGTTWSPSLPLGYGTYVVPAGVYRIKVVLGNSRKGEGALAVFVDGAYPYEYCNVGYYNILYGGGAEATEFYQASAEYPTGIYLDPAEWTATQQGLTEAYYDVVPGQTLGYWVGKGGTGEIAQPVPEYCKDSNLSPKRGSDGWNGSITITPIT